MGVSSLLLGSTCDFWTAAPNGRVATPMTGRPSGGTVKAVMGALGLTPDQAGTYGTITAGSLFGAGPLLASLVNRVAVRRTLVVTFAVLGIAIWTQRATLEDKVRRCDTSVMGISLHLNADQLAACKHVTSR